MAALKVAQLRSALDAFAELYANCGATEQAAALKSLSRALQKADKRTVDEVVSKLNATDPKPQNEAKVLPRH